ncbi:flagellar associated protein [Pycnococcus provasolii]
MADDGEATQGHVAEMSVPVMESQSSISGISGVPAQAQAHGRGFESGVPRLPMAHHPVSRQGRAEKIAAVRPVVEFQVDFVLPGGWKVKRLPERGAVYTKKPREQEATHALRLEQDFVEKTRAMREEAMAKKAERDALVLQMRAADEAMKKRHAELAAAKGAAGSPTTKGKKGKKGKGKEKEKEKDRSPSPTKAQAQAQQDKPMDRPAWMDVPDVDTNVGVYPDPVQRANMRGAHRYTHEVLTLPIAKKLPDEIDEPFLPVLYDACLSMIHEKKKSTAAAGKKESSAADDAAHFKPIATHVNQIKQSDGGKTIETRKLMQGQEVRLRVVVPDFACPKWNVDTDREEIVWREHLRLENGEEDADAEAAADDGQQDGDAAVASTEMDGGDAAAGTSGASHDAQEPAMAQGTGTDNNASNGPTGRPFGFRAGELDYLSEDPTKLDDPHVNTLVRQAKLFNLCGESLTESEAEQIDKFAWLLYTVDDLSDHRDKVEEIQDEKGLHKWIDERPFSPETLRAKARSELRIRALDPSSALRGGFFEAAHGLWELAVHYSGEFVWEDCQALAKCLERGPPCAKWAAAACIWKLSAKAGQRMLLAEAGCVELVIDTTRTACGWKSPLVVEMEDKYAKLHFWRDRILYHCLGALNVLSVDRVTRSRAYKHEPDFSTMMSVANMFVSKLTHEVERYVDNGVSVYAQIRAVRRLQREFRDLLARRGFIKLGNKEGRVLKDAIFEGEGEGAEERVRRGDIGNKDAMLAKALSLKKHAEEDSKEAQAQEQEMEQPQGEVGEEDTANASAEQPIDGDAPQDGWFQEDDPHRAEFERAFDEDNTEDNVKLAQRIQSMESQNDAATVAKTIENDGDSDSDDEKKHQRPEVKDEILKKMPYNPLDGYKFLETVEFPIGRKRQLSAEILYSMLHRDSRARHDFCQADGIRQLMPLLHSANKQVSFIACMILANFALDRNLAKVIAETGKSLRLFDELLYQISVCMDKLDLFAIDGLHQFQDDTGEGELEITQVDDDVENITMLLESSACAMWGIGMSLIEVAKYDEPAVDATRIARLSFLGSRCLATPGVGHSTQSIAGCLAAFSRHRPTSRLMADQIDPDNEMHEFGDVDDALRSLLRPPIDRPGVTKRGTGWVRATAAAAVGCLAAHQYERGEEPVQLLEEEDVETSRCLYGPNRDVLVKCGLVHSILDAQLAKTWLNEARAALNQAAAASIMLLSTAGEGWSDLEIRDTFKWSALDEALDVLEFLAAALWVLCRHDGLRARLLNMHADDVTEAAKEAAGIPSENEKKPHVTFEPLGSLASLVDNVLSDMLELAHGNHTSAYYGVENVVEIIENPPFSFNSIRLQEVDWFDSLDSRVQKSRQKMASVVKLTKMTTSSALDLLGDFTDSQADSQAKVVDNEVTASGELTKPAFFSRSETLKRTMPDHGVGPEAEKRWNTLMGQHARRKGMEPVSYTTCAASALSFAIASIHLLVLGPDDELDFLYRDDDLFAMDAGHLSWWTSKPLQGGLRPIAEGSGIRRALRSIASCIGSLPLGTLKEIHDGWGTRFASGRTGEWAVESTDYFHTMRLACAASWAFAAADAELKRCLLEDGVLENVMRVVESWAPRGYGASAGDDTARRIDLPEWVESPGEFTSPGWGGSDPAPSAMRIAIGLLVHLCRQQADSSVVESEKKLLHKIGIVRLSTALGAAAAYGHVRDVRMADAACAACVWIAHAAGPEGRAEMVSSNFVVRMFDVVRACYVRAERDEARWLECGWGYAGAHTEAVMRVGDLALTALVNLSVECPSAQEDICKRGVVTLLRLSRQDPDIELAGHSIELATMVLTNCALNTANKTRLYKLELQRNRVSIVSEAAEAANELQGQIERSRSKREAWRAEAERHEKKGAGIKAMGRRSQIGLGAHKPTEAEERLLAKKAHAEKLKERFLEFSETIGTPKAHVVGRVLRSENSLLPKPKEDWEKYADPNSVEMQQLRHQREQARQHWKQNHWPDHIPPPISDTAKRMSKEVSMEDQRERLKRHSRPSSRQSKGRDPRPSTPFERLAESLSEPELNMVSMGMSPSTMVGRATGESLRTISQRIRSSKALGPLPQPMDDSTFRSRQGAARWLPRLSRYHHRVDGDGLEEDVRLLMSAGAECGELLQMERPVEVAAYFEEVFDNAVQRATSRLELVVPENSLMLTPLTPADGATATPANGDGNQEDGAEGASPSPSAHGALSASSPGPTSPQRGEGVDEEAEPEETPIAGVEGEMETPAPGQDSAAASTTRPLSPEASRARPPSTLGARPPVYPAHLSATSTLGTKMIKPREDVEDAMSSSGGYGFSGIPTRTEKGVYRELAPRPFSAADVHDLSMGGRFADEGRPLTVMHGKRGGQRGVEDSALGMQNDGEGNGDVDAQQLVAQTSSVSLRAESDQSVRAVEVTVGNNTARGPGFHTPTTFNWTEKQNAKRRAAMGDSAEYFDDKMGDEASMSIFRHVPGSLVYEGLIPTFPLPNGREAHYYWTAKKGCDSILVPLEGPPSRPKNLLGLGKMSLPRLPLFDALTMPTQRSESQLKIVPSIGPDPTRHTLRDTGRFGDLVDDNVRFEVLPRRVYRVDLSVEEIAPPPPEERPVFDIDASVYAPRRFKEADCKTYWDTEACHRKMFQFDWLLICDRSRFRKFSVIQVKGSDKNVNIGENALKQLREFVRNHYHKIIAMHAFYATQGTGRGFRMTQNAWEKFTDDNNLISDKFNARDAIEQFIVATIVDNDVKLKEMGGNLQRAGSMGRREFIECLIRSAVWLFGHEKNPDSQDERANTPEGCMEILFEKHIDPNLNPMVNYFLQRNDFRTERLYNLEMETMWRSDCSAFDRGDGTLVAIRKGLCLELLKYLYAELGVRRTKHGKEVRMPQKETWIDLLSMKLGIVTTQLQFSLQEAIMCYKASQMDVIDDVQHGARSESLAWVDFLESIGRVADSISLPPADKLLDAGYFVGVWPDLANAWSTPRASSDFLAPKTRPLVEKVTAMLTIIFWRNSDEYTESTAMRVKSYKSRAEASSWRTLPGL